MQDVFKICSFFINKGISESKPVSNISLQKLLYFAQGLFLAETGDKLFHNKIYAWEYGPVVKEVYQKFKHFGNNQIASPQTISLILGNDFLKQGELDNASFLTDVWDSFKDFAPFQLVELTHVKDSPWHNISMQYGGNPPHDTEIPVEDMKVYFKETFLNHA